MYGTGPWPARIKSPGKFLVLSIPGNVDGRSGMADTSKADPSKVHPFVISIISRLTHPLTVLAFFHEGLFRELILILWALSVSIVRL